jgi:hypothetical protein
MAKGRRYARDARGRFASTGATARGGRLKTPSGGKRATVTASANGGGKGTISKPAGLQPGAIKPKPQAKPAAKASAPKATNKVSASPRRLSKAEQDYMDIQSQKSKFRSDKKVREEMQRRGHLKGSDPQGDLIKIAYTARAKKGQNPPEMSSWISL